MKFIAVLFFSLLAMPGLSQNVSLHFLGPDRIGYSWVDEVHDADVFIMDKNHKEVKRTISEPIIFHSNFTAVPLVVFPSDELNISFTKLDVKITSNNNPIRNYEQLCTKQLAKEYGELVFMATNSADNIRVPQTKNEFAKTDKKYFKLTGKHLKKPVRSLDQRDSLLYATYKGRLSIIDIYHKKYGLSDAYIRFMSQVVLYRYLYFSLLGYQLMNDRRLSMTLQKYVADPSLQNDSLVRNVNMYRAFYLTLNRYRTQIESGYATDPVAEIAMAERTLRGKTKDNVIMSITQAELQRKKAETPLLTAFYENCKDTGYVNKINDMVLVFEKTGTKNTSLISYNKNKSNFKDLIRSKVGKIVVVDFWASWCAPCLEEMPSYPTLIAKMNGKPVEFVFLSIDDDAGNWKKSATLYKDFITEKNSYIVVNGSAAPLAKKYGISTIPRLIIFNSKGEVAYLKAPGPSDPALLQLLLNELKKL